MDGPTKEDMYAQEPEYDSTQRQDIDILHTTNSDQLLSMLVLSDRKQDYESFGKIRSELLYRLACADPLIGWIKPRRK